jgi:hypothetical protein
VIGGKENMEGRLDKLLDKGQEELSEGCAAEAEKILNELLDYANNCPRVAKELDANEFSKIDMKEVYGKQGIISEPVLTALAKAAKKENRKNKQVRLLLIIYTNKEESYNCERVFLKKRETS